MVTAPANVRFAILASGRGSNAIALMEAFHNGLVPAQLALVVSNKDDALVLERATSRGHVAICIPNTGKTREAHEQEVLDVLLEHRVDHVLLAGYMRILSPYFLSRFHGKVLNIHPSLLPEFPGLHGASSQWKARRKVVGATVHYVDEGVDSGPVLLQGSLVARGDEQADELADRLLLEVEHVIYPRAVRLFLDRLYPHA